MEILINCLIAILVVTILAILFAIGYILYPALDYYKRKFEAWINGWK